MICPFCANETTRVLDKREGNNGKTTRRRRECQKCSRRFTTFERVETLDLLVVKKDGRREAFDRVKLRSGIIKSCEKRPVSAEEIEKIVDEIEAKLRKINTNEVSTKKIGELVTQRLKKLDEVAYIRFASVYRQFADIGDFEKELAKLSKSLPADRQNLKQNK
ncbi:transcriptional regulator NrdR [Candidatus Curtissbacteria bacterium RIFCSPHIGHO2_01_FULL_41_44]|uniref:Transcriptional repressor NrdR n=1 Tax=Candidatus Curtissbacteria bacterium RIFCSPLOWO2_01_FULL_42_50 TaxID=1797730 RepID=A0A1F5H3W3_9BACT|nr:MAG: transcriptional regulator NrdR [Candidatus Curtissbacteria bacterium RIFCSPHIGHO2_01_FULL_41_44]OGD94651.1 MAG: transcriptional regulator NrdR [Candidatus Curtissbacteria bacterium RIFCSPHIGHO2_02_FULL_42_58]OGD96847.1 MAG: transcriptional regulator NrdR [Candidatus Curtissbacteria bacterium RIFCSPHIGHO2_12_FULL_42_33]OGD98735.1 MAG: transcriptional regulator NrdR [Candidatus Curtissbacteria bacterium RIFCSPLOWO2_01_FULL_42_50]OGE02236.1 MAG: transcriptional regulator NrdR [Candidatus C